MKTILLHFAVIFVIIPVISNGQQRVEVNEMNVSSMDFDNVRTDDFQSSGHEITFAGVAFKDDAGNLHVNLDPEEIRGMLVFIKNEGSENTSPLLGDLGSVSPYVTPVHETSTYCGILCKNQYKYISFGVLFENTDELPEDFSIPFSLTLNHLYRKETTIDFTYDGKNESYPALCDPVGKITYSMEGDRANISWENPEGSSPESYVIYKGIWAEAVVQEANYSVEAVAGERICIEALYANGCTSESVCVDLIINDIDEVANNILVYPNPADDIVNITGEDIKTVCIYNMMGQMIEKIEVIDGTATVKTSFYAPDTYFMEIIMNNNLKVNKKFIVIH